FRYAPSLPPCDALIQVLKGPAQPSAQGAPHTGLAGTHKADQQHSLRCHVALARSRPLTTRRSQRTSRALRTPFRAIRFSFRVYFSERFLRWILPLKVRRTTEDAAFLMVPEKALPTLVGNQLWFLGWRGMSSRTSPRTERALTSAEVHSGIMASIL